MRSINWWQVIPSLSIGFIIGLPINGAAIFGAIFKASNAYPIRQGQKDLINPLVGFEVSARKTDFQEYRSLENKLIKLVDQEIEDKKISKASVYFRDLNNGHWTGINENDFYNPASLMKIPLTIAYYRIADDNPAILQETIQYTGQEPDENRVQNYKPSKTLIPGGWYTVEDLIERMLIYSDNNAYHLLLGYMKLQDIQEVFSDLNVNLPPGFGTKVYDYMSPKLYSSFFRILYSASYLSQRFSDRTLQILTKTTFDRGLVAGLPTDTKVAHKFGESVLSDSRGAFISKELHDCGMIYVPKNPYLLCVMTVGVDSNNLEGVIKNISSIVYSDSRSQK